MAFKAGNLAKVTLGATVIAGMANWKLSGVTVDLLESTAFGDTAKQFMTGLLDYGTVTFSGLYDPADTVGQGILISALMNNSKISVIRFYVDAASYWCPNTSFGSGGISGAGILVQSVSIGQDKSGLASIDVSAKASGPFWLV